MAWANCSLWLSCRHWADPRLHQLHVDKCVSLRPRNQLQCNQWHSRHRFLYLHLNKLVLVIYLSLVCFSTYLMASCLPDEAVPILKKQIVWLQVQKRVWFIKCLHHNTRNCSTQLSSRGPNASWKIQFDCIKIHQVRKRFGKEDIYQLPYELGYDHPVWCKPFEIEFDRLSCSWPGSLQHLRTTFHLVFSRHWSVAMKQPFIQIGLKLKLRVESIIAKFLHLSKCRLNWRPERDRLHANQWHLSPQAQRHHFPRSPVCRASSCLVCTSLGVASIRRNSSRKLLIERSLDHLALGADSLLLSLANWNNHFHCQSMWAQLLLSFCPLHQRHLPNLLLLLLRLFYHLKPF